MMLQLILTSRLLTTNLYQISETVLVERALLCLDADFSPAISSCSSISTFKLTIIRRNLRVTEKQMVTLTVKRRYSIFCWNY